MIKVLQYIPSFDVGGIESFVLNMNEKMNEECQFTYLVEKDVNNYYKQKIEKLGGKIIRISNLTKEGVLKHIISIRNVLKEGKYDAIHVHGCDIRIFALLFAKICGIKVRILHIHTTKIERYVKIKRFFLNINIKLSNKLLACSDEAARSMYGKRENDAVIVKNGIDLEKYKYDEIARKKLREGLGISEDTVVLGHVGRLVDVKNQSFIIDIYNKYRQMNLKSKLVIVGNGPLLEELKRKAENYNLNNDVLFLIDRTDVNEIYSAMDCFLLPSKYEGFGIVVIEAQANGLKSFVSKNILSQIDVTNTLIKLDIYESPQYWAEAILNQNLERYDKIEQIKKAGFDSKNVSQELLKIYKGEFSEDIK